MKINRLTYKAIAALLCAAAVGTAAAYGSGVLDKLDKAGLEIAVNAGTSLGGASPLPLPAEIRKIDSYSPSLNLMLGATVTKWFAKDRKWGVMAGAMLDTKGMKTRATVKNYGMEILDNGNKLTGRWTGHVQTRYHTQQLVVPICGVYKINPRLRVQAGPYLSFAFENDFDGFVSNGYLREGDPTGDKYVFEGDASASYDFGNELRHFQWGFCGGVAWRAYRHLTVNGTLMWGCNNIFKSSFKTISFNMYPIFLNVGFGYVF